MGRVDGQVSGKRTAECLIGSDQYAEAFIDLPIFPLTPLLNRLHQ